MQGLETEEKELQNAYQSLAAELKQAESTVHHLAGQPDDAALKVNEAHKNDIRTGDYSVSHRSDVMSSSTIYMYKHACLHA